MHYTVHLSPTEPVHQGSITSTGTVNVVGSTGSKEHDTIGFIHACDVNLDGQLYDDSSLKMGGIKYSGNFDDKMFSGDGSSVSIPSVQRDSSLFQNALLLLV